MLDPNQTPYEQRTARPAESSQRPALVVGFFAAIAVAVLATWFPAQLGYLGAAALGAVTHRTLA
ncbi:MAG: hypothetical protein V5A46_09080 [Haloferacaceae archaeon]